MTDGEPQDLMGRLRGSDQTRHNSDGLRQTKKSSERKEGRENAKLERMDDEMPDPETCGELGLSH